LAQLPGKNGARIAIQTVVGHKPNEEARNLVKLLNVTREQAVAEGREGILDLVICVAINKRVQKSIERALKQTNDGALPHRLVLLEAENHLIDAAYDWIGILEGDL